MKDFANLGNSSGSFPDVVGVDASGPGETDGTELTADLFNDIMGFMQALLNDQGGTPSGTSETASGTSQILDAIKSLIHENSANWYNNWLDRTNDGSFSGTFYGGDTDESNGISVIVGTNGEIQYSYDGKTWNSNTQGTSDFYDVHYNGTHWVAVGENGALYYAADPTGSWTSNTQGASHFYGVHYDGTYWVAVGASGTLYYATDPTGSWTSNTQGANNLMSVHYNGTYWVAVGASGTLYYATDPTGSWTSNTQGSNDYTYVTYDSNNGYWLAVGDDGVFIYNTTHTGTWTDNSISDAGTYDFEAIVYHENAYVIVGDSRHIYVTKDITGSWIRIEKDVGGYGYKSLSTATNFLIACGVNGTIVTSLRHS